MSEAAEGPIAVVRPKHRSPVYPAIDLETAIDRTKQLWSHAERHFVPLSDAMRIWGYSPKSSGGLQTIAAMKRFGLADDEGTGSRRQVRVSDLGRAIVTDDPESAERWERIAEAALLPKIHRDLWAEYSGNLPPDSSLRFQLVNDRGFSEGAARDLIDQFRKTIAFAGLTEQDGILSPSYQDSQETEETPSTAVPAPSRGRVTTTAAASSGIQLPVGPGQFAVLQAPFPISEDQWALMLSVLQAMKPGLVSGEQDEE